ncbi:hypothetical protein SFRURICE_003897 [Spodoptera frugiperda]|nr:hypothetical protein SFRURICE_003897 [Spodoptera frugiperda]
MILTRKAHARQEESKLDLALSELKASKELCNQLVKERDDNVREFLDILNTQALQEESKLDLALSELKASKELCDQLLKERNDNVREFLDILNSNKKLKCEMAARDRLQFVVDGFSQCSNEYEQTLHDKAHLEQQLHEANSQISQLETINLNITTSLNNSLFSELVSARASQTQHIDLNPVTIDLICETHARQEESKLDLALSELKASKELCDQLLKERDDNVREFLDILNRNKKLKCEMAQLHIQHTNAIEARDRLQFVVDGFSQCSNEYEQTLHDKAHLEQQLHEANSQISQLETINLNVTPSLNNSLFSELVSAPHTLQEESKLNLALSELKASKELCDQLLKERDDNVREFLDILNRNKKLKCEMAQLYIQHTESKLNLALSELKASKELCDQLLKERDDNVREFLDILNRNKKLKCEMAQLHIQHTNAIEARDRLQFVVDGFSQCSNEYEQTLHDKAHLEQQLHEANSQISQLETINLNITPSLNNSLFSELVSARASQT